MITNNRDDFNQCVALVFDRLYQEFPKETNITVDEFVDSSNEEMTDNYFATIRFLQREGFISYQILNYDTFTGVTLTIKGLKILDTLSTGDGETTIAQEISIALQQHSKKLIGAIIQKIINLSL
ncbi:MAG: hypothetical protein HC877_10355 [Thioploca sp.]|nr:hypothetical protein [Thioploca sp.]